MTHELSGECLCGAVRYRIVAEAPKAMFLCHCTRCRKETGSLHGANVFFREGELTFTPDAHIFHDSRAEWADRAADAPRHSEYAG